MSIILYHNELQGEHIEIPYPITIDLDLNEARDSLNLPTYIDLNDSHVIRAIGILYGASIAQSIIGNSGQVSKSPLPIVMFGGCGVRFHCPSCNQINGPFWRVLNDIDIVTARKYGSNVMEMLTVLGQHFGSRFSHVLRKSDRNFNAMRAGHRYRILAVKEVTSEGQPIPEITDIFCDKLPFCHILDVSDALKNPFEHLYTIGLENLALSKLQFISKIPAQQLGLSNQLRVLDEQGNNVLIGLESKDVYDFLAILNDHDIGQGYDFFNIDKFLTPLRKSWGFHRTVSLNLSNISIHLQKYLSDINLDKEYISNIKSRLETITEAVKTVKPRYYPWLNTKEWWETVEDLQSSYKDT